VPRLRVILDLFENAFISRVNRRMDTGASGPLWCAQSFVSWVQKSDDFLDAPNAVRDASAVKQLTTAQSRLRNSASAITSPTSWDPAGAHRGFQPI
jgi:hypothetical protein